MLSSVGAVPTLATTGEPLSPCDTVVADEPSVTFAEHQDPLRDDIRLGARAHSRPVRVLHVLNRLDPGGTELGTLKIIAGLPLEHFEQHLCVIRGFDPKLAALPFLTNKLITAGEMNSGRQIALFRLAKIMKEFRADIVHSRNWGGIEAILAARIARVPVVIHSEHGYEVDNLAGLPLHRRILRRGFYAFADAVFSVTDELRQYHAQQAWWSPEKMQVIRNGVDTHRFAPRPENRSSLRAKLGLPQQSIVIGTSGRLAPIKDFPTLLRSVETLVRAGGDLHVVLVGSGPERERLRAYVQNSSELRGRVLFLDTTDRIAEILNAFDVFVLPSLCEGMSNALLEAMACALPVIATRAGGNPEVIAEGECGWLFPPGDVSQLAERLHSLMAHQDLRLKFGAAARQRILQHFSLERMLADYKNLYLELAARRGLRTGQ